MPRSLSGRIALAFAAMVLAALVGIGGSLFVVLNRSYADDQQNTLVTVSIALASRPATIATGRVPLDTIFGRGNQLITEDISVYIVRSGRLERVQGPDAGISLPDLPTLATARTIKGTLPGNGAYAYGATVLGATARRQYGLDAVIVVSPDTATSKAVHSVAVAIGALLVVLILVGALAALLVTRSITRPIRRLAHATSRVAGAGANDPPLPEDGPEEVRELTRHFNEMSAELGRTHEQETQLLASLRHDLRTPLTSIAGFAEAISDGTVSGEAAQTAARTIVEESRRLDRLVAELGVIERLREGPAALRRERLDAASLIASTVERFSPQATGREVELVAADSQDLAFNADRLAVERILQNLVENSLKVADRGGHVWIEGLASHLPGRPDGVVLRVTDDGPGFPPGTIPHVFERFFRADPSRSGQGSGLGLAIVRELAVAHGGEAWAENVAPRGARVSVYLPR